MTPSPEWYVVHTQANAEARAVQHLARQGFTAYLPRYLRRRRHARKVDVVPAALFPRYLFVSLDLTAQRWRSINSTMGVSQLICRGDVPVPIASTVIEHLKRSEDGCGHILLSSQALFRRGDAVQIIEGPFASCLGIFQETTDSDRVAILLEFLGRKARVVVDADLIAAA